MTDLAYRRKRLQDYPGEAKKYRLIYDTWKRLGVSGASRETGINRTTIQRTIKQLREDAESRKLVGIENV